MLSFYVRRQPAIVTPPSIDFGSLEWEPTGCETDPMTRMLAQFSIGGIPMHLEAWRVTPFTVGEVQRFRCTCAEDENSGFCLEDDYEQIANTFNTDSAFMTIEVLEEGATVASEYVLIAQPHGD